MHFPTVDIVAVVDLGQRQSAVSVPASRGWLQGRAVGAQQLLQVHGIREGFQTLLLHLMERELPRTP